VDAEARLRERARASGLSPDDFARRFVEQAVAPQTNGTHANAESAAKRVAKLHEWAGTLNSPLLPVDDSRESIYSGRGE